MNDHNDNFSDILEKTDIDKLGHALLTLTKELWVLKDRQRILEAALEDAGITTQELINNYQPDDQLKDELTKSREALINEMITVLTQTPDVDS